MSFACSYCKTKTDAVSARGLCDDCLTILLPIVQRHVDIILESNEVAGRTKNIDTKLSRIRVCIDNSRALARYQKDGAWLTVGDAETFEAAFQADLAAAIKAYGKDLENSSAGRETPAATVKAVTNAIAKLEKLREYFEDEAALDAEIDRFRAFLEAFHEAVARAPR